MTPRLQRPPDPLRGIMRNPTLSGQVRVTMSAAVRTGLAAGRVGTSYFFPCQRRPEAGGGTPPATGSQTGLVDAVYGLCVGEALELQLVDQARARERAVVEIVLRG